MASTSHVSCKSPLFTLVFTYGGFGACYEQDERRCLASHSNPFESCEQQQHKPKTVDVRCGPALTAVSCISAESLLHVAYDTKCKILKTFGCQILFVRARANGSCTATLWVSSEYTCLTKQGVFVKTLPASTEYC